MSFVEFVVSTVVALGGVLPYIPQYLEIIRTKNSEGFSTMVCLILLIANILRILFWFGHPFETPLLIQSILINLVMIALLHVCINTRPSFVKKTLVWNDLNMSFFWDWTDFQSYIIFIVFFIIFSSVITLFFINNVLYIEGLGLVALLTEAALGLPQLLHNYQLKSTAGMSVGMVLLWTCGDIGKTIYFILKQVPSQFLVCGITQIIIDLLILLQVVLYRPTYRSV